MNRPESVSLPSPYFREEHELLRAQVRRFVETEIKPHGLKWEEQGYVPREVLRRMGELGFLGIRYPAEYGGSEMDTLGSIVLAEELGRSTFAAPRSPSWCTPTWPRCTWRTQARRRRRRAGCRRSSPGRAITAVAVTEPDAGSDVKGHPHHRAPRRRRLRAQRLQDVHHQRRPRRPLFRRRQDRARRAPLAGDLDVHGRERARPAFASAARSTSTAGAPPIPPSSCSRIAAFRRKTCSARKAAASTPS